MNIKLLTESALTQAGFGGFPNNYVARDHLVKTIDDLFSADIDVVNLEGRSGIGLTSLAAEYAIHSGVCVVALFIRGGSRLSYAPFRLATDLLTQAETYLGVGPTTPISDIFGAWHGRFAQLQEQQRRQGKRILFVVDGLHQIPLEDSRFVSEIFKDLLAIGVPGVKHLVTLGEKTSLGKGLHTEKSRPYRASRLSQLEAETIFKGAGVAEHQLKEYYSYTDGIPALVQSACRLHIKKIELNGLSKEISSFYAAEWEQFLAIADLQIDRLTNALGFLCFGKGAVGIDEITEICLLKNEDLLILGDREIFLRTTNSRKNVEFLSFSHREFVASKLSAKKEEVINMMIDRLLVKPQSETSIALLPTFYEELGRFDDLIDYLSPENLGRYLDYSRSATALRRRTELGMKMAMDGAKHIQTYQFALQTSLIRSMDVPRLSPEQMGALAGLGEIDQAFTHSQLARTEEDRLMLLSILVRELHRGGISIPDAVEVQLRAMLSKVDLRGSGTSGIAIATNLVSAFPELALKLVESEEHIDSASREVAIAQLAVNEVIRAKVEDRKPSSFAGKIKNSELEGFVVTLQAILLTKSVDELDLTTKKLPPKLRSYLFRQWAIANRLTKNSYCVIELTLADLVKDASYLPTAGDLWELCLTLSSCEDLKILDELSKRIEGFKGSLSQAGSTIDLIGLDLELAIAQALSVSVASSERFEDIYLRVSELVDESIRAEGYVLLLAALIKVEKKVFINHVDAVRNAVEEELSLLLDNLLSQTADHALVFEPTLRILLDVDPSFSIELVEKFNTEERRDDGFSTLADAYVRQGTIEIDFLLLGRMIAAICDRNKRESILVSILGVIRSNDKFHSTRLNLMLADVVEIRDPVLRCTGLAHAVDINFSKGSRVDFYFSHLLIALKEIDRIPTRPREAYRFVQAIIKHDKSEGLRIYRAVEQELKAYRMASESTLVTSYLCARAAVIGFGALLEKQAHTEEYIGRLASAIEAVPSISMRTNLFADLAIRAHQKKAKDIFDRVCSKQLYPALANIDPKHLDTRETLTVEAFPCIYLWNQTLAFELINKCELPAKEYALTNVFDYVVMGIAPNEPSKTDKLGQFSLDYPRALQAVNLLSMFETDAVIAEKIEAFCKVLGSKASRNSIPGHQRISLLQSVNKIIQEKLPDPKNIRHNGWSLLSRAYATPAEADLLIWEALCGEAEDVPNVSDRVYILGALSKAIPEKHIALRRIALNKARDALELIPSAADAMIRRISLSDVAAGFEKATAERLLREALDDSLKIKDKNTALAIQKKIIDTAQQFDKNLAEKLIDRLDDDPARSRAKAELRHDARSTKRKEAISEGEYDLLNGQKAEAINRACFDALTSLNNLKISPPRLDDLARLLSHLSAFAIREVYWGYAWFLRSCQLRLESTEEVNRILRPMFEVTLLSCELAQRMSDGSDPTLFWGGGSDSESLVVGPSDRLDAVSFLTDWFASECGDEVLICDPYFTVNDLELIKSFHFKKPGAKFTILSCKSSTVNSSRDVVSNLEAGWRDICEQQPPEIRLIVVLYDGEGIGGPLHDRWLICRDAGLRVGTSHNSLGLSKLSEISALSRTEIPPLLATLNRFVMQQDRNVDGKRLRYLTESL